MKSGILCCFGMVVAAVTASASPAKADYQFDPADLPKDFRCIERSTKAECLEEQRHEAWLHRYGQDFDRWHSELLFNTNIYFGDGPLKRPRPDGSDDDDGAWTPETLGYETPNLVDAVYRVALRHFSQGWAFAVDMVCSKPEDQSCAPKLRMVSYRSRKEVGERILKSIRHQFPTKRSELARTFGAIMSWREADLRSCPGALEQLLALPAQRGIPIWHSRYVKWLGGTEPKKSDEIVASTDGAGVFVRAKGAQDPEDPDMNGGPINVIYSQWNGGEGMEWAMKMEEVVRPCLRSTEATAPWDKLEPPDSNSRR